MRRESRGTVQSFPSSLSIDPDTMPSQSADDATMGTALQKSVSVLFQYFGLVQVCSLWRIKSEQELSGL